ncbi:prepilin-type N-terminal cleavage/methylation domain-containing protein [Methylohalobius crimeensis]|uniref:prepilin-type N-terminal cleavage/methylation domain-containing protein n=1 Tax=Methylohalobius crimeensis TaxID=244365 RepID=UPI0003B4B3B5|nr:prepilin-type N-terminal cleavage/methylation domain-containing protein [Methylohalobius crimeensis]
MRGLIAFRQRGLTLLELVVSLLVMTILTTVAIRSVSGIQEQTRFEKTRQQGEEFIKAMVEINQKAIRGFVADTGTLPTNLRALIDRGSLPSYNVLTFSSTTCPAGINMHGGWAGPYMQTSANPDDPDALRDAWGGKEGTLGNTTNYGWGVVSPTSQRLEITSYGCDRKIGTSASFDCPNHYQTDQTFAVTTYMWRSKEIDSISAHLTLENTNKILRMCLFYRNVATGQVESVWSNIASIPGNVTLAGTPSTASFSFSPTTTIPAGQNQIALFEVTATGTALYQNKQPIKVDLLPGSYFPVVFW